MNKEGEGEAEDNKEKMPHEKEKTLSSEERAEYFAKLDKWLLEYYAWHSFVATFPYYLASSQLLVTNTATNPNLATNYQQNYGNENELHQRTANEPLLNQFQAGANEGIEYRIPSIWKRFVAELIDSMILLLLKLFITFIAVEIFDFIDLEKYYIDALQASLKVDYKMALELTSGILILEFVHRIFVCIFEALWLQRGRNGRIGGSTPGKSVMGLKVVLCHNITPIARLDNNVEVVQVSPGTDLGIMTALGRFNRTGYDLICNTLVVEDSYRDGNNNINNLNNDNFNHAGRVQ